MTAKPGDPPQTGSDEKQTVEDEPTEIEAKGDRSRPKPAKAEKDQSMTDSQTKMAPTQKRQPRWREKGKHMIYLSVRKRK